MALRTKPAKRFRDSRNGWRRRRTKSWTWLFIRHEKNKGKAAAIHTALSAATEEVMRDSRRRPRVSSRGSGEDGGSVPGGTGGCGIWFAVHGQRVPARAFFPARVGKQFLTLLCNVVSDLNLSDMETCYKMVRTTLLKSIPLTGKGFEIEPEIAIKLAKRGARIFEVPIRYAGRTYQEGKKIGWRDGVRAVTSDPAIRVVR